ncbi:MAG: addiction module protein [Kofleriaceae bacterium]|nr:addiction module protein [Kofleriaceae bacterium]
MARLWSHRSRVPPPPSASNIISALIASPTSSRESGPLGLDLSATELSPEWQSEITNRIAQIESGDIELVSWKEIRADVDAQLQSVKLRAK